MNKNRFQIVLFLIAILFAGCMKDDEWILNNGSPGSFQKGVFIVNEGNFMYGNSTLSFYDPANKKIRNDLFYEINGLPLGDVGQSMTIHENKGYLVVNNSGKVYIIDASTGRYTSKITGLTSPRYIHFINSSKAYITDLYAGKITVINPLTNQITGSISTGSHFSTEQMIQIGDLVFVTCWSYDNTILVIDTTTDSIVKEIPTGRQPGSIRVDADNKLWVMCDGGWGKNGTSIPMLQKINPLTGNTEVSLELPADVNAKKMDINRTKDTLFFIDKGVWKMSVKADKLPEMPFIPNRKLIYALGVNPENSEIYFSDAIDYSQKGVVYRYSSSGAAIDSFKTGITPGAFSFR